MNDRTNKINIFDYNDYRKFLRDWYDGVKQSSPGFSYRAFSKRAGFNSSNFFMLVMQGKRNLSEEGIKNMMAGLRLNKQEQEFFRNLVFLNQAKRDGDKIFYYHKLLQSRKYRQLKPIEGKNYEYYSTWYHPVVRELLVSKGFDGTPIWIAEHISPPITVVQAEKSIRLLEELGFVKKIGPSKWKQTSTIVSTGPELRSVIVHNYHKSLLELSKEVMDRLTSKDRDTSALTLGMKKSRISEIREKIRRFRQELLEMISEDIEPEEVVQLNIQFFPVTKL